MSIYVNEKPRETFSGKLMVVSQRIRVVHIADRIGVKIINIERSGTIYEKHPAYCGSIATWP